MGVRITSKWLGFVVFLMLCLECQRSSAGIPRRKQFDRLMRAYMRERGVPGMSVAISRRGKILYAKGYGHASFNRLVTPWSLFRIAGVSKTITAAAILQLHERGRLALDARIFGTQGILKQYAVPPGADKRLYNITVRHLLHHSGGWDSRKVGEPMFYRFAALLQGLPEPADKSTIIRYMLGKPLQFDPGTKYAYCDFGYMLLGRVIEQVTGEPYSSYATSMLWKIGVYRMRLGRTIKRKAIDGEVSYFFSEQVEVQSVIPGEGLVSPPYGSFYMENMDSCAGWLASTTDLVRIFNSLDGNNGFRLINKTSLGLMLGRPPFSRKRRTWYGLGMAVHKASRRSGKTWWHSGAIAGSTAMVTRDTSGYTWAFLLNTRIAQNDLNDFMTFTLRRIQGVLKGYRSSFMHPALSITKDDRNLVRAMIPEVTYHTISTNIVNRGYRLSWIDGYESKRSTYFNTIWVKDNITDWFAYFNLTGKEYGRYFVDMVGRGYRLSHVESYISRNKLYYTAIFLHQPWPPWVSYFGYSGSQHQARLKTLTKKGYRLTLQSVTLYRGRMYIAAIYDKVHVTGLHSRLGMTSRRFHSEFKRQVRLGRSLTYVQAYQQNGVAKFSAIWSVQKKTQWAARHDMTTYILFNHMNAYAEENVQLKCLTAYVKNGVLNFAALWRQ